MKLAENQEYCRSRDIPKLFPYLFSETQWAWVIRNRQANGFDAAVRRVGSCLLVSIPAFFEVIEKSQAK